MGTEQVQIDNDLILSLREEIAALNEELTALREINSNLRNNQRVGRTVVRNLREKVNEMQHIAEENDEQFQYFCQEDIDNAIVEEVAPVEQDGLSDATGTVEPLF